MQMVFIFAFLQLSSPLFIPKTSLGCSHHSITTCPLVAHEQFHALLLAGFLCIWVIPLRLTHQTNISMASHPTGLRSDLQRKYLCLCVDPHVVLHELYFYLSWGNLLFSILLLCIWRHIYVDNKHTNNFPETVSSNHSNSLMTRSCCPFLFILDVNHAYFSDFNANVLLFLSVLRICSLLIHFEIRTRGVTTPASVPPDWTNIIKASVGIT